MTCPPSYILSDDEVTTICANHLLLDNLCTELRVIIGGLPLQADAVAQVMIQWSRLEVSLNNLRPLITHLYELQKQT